MSKKGEPSSLSLKQVEKIKNVLSGDDVAGKCEPTNFDIISEIKSLKESLKSEMDSLKATVSSIVQDNSAIKVTVNKLAEKQDVTAADLRSLRTDYNNFIYQQSILNDILITGIPVNTSKELIQEALSNLCIIYKFNTTDIVSTQTKVIEVKRSSRSGSGRFLQVIVRFKDYVIKRYVLSMKKQLGTLAVQQLLPNISPTPKGEIYIRERLTAHNALLLKKLNELKKAEKIAYAWTNRGNIYVKIKATDEKVIQIKTLDEVTNLVSLINKR